MKHLKIKIMSIALLAAATSSMAQSLDKMNWLNEPQQWEIKEGKALVMDVPAKTDFWRISHYGCIYLFLCLGNCRTFLTIGIL